MDCNLIACMMSSPSSTCASLDVVLQPAGHGFGHCFYTLLFGVELTARIPATNLLLDEHFWSSGGPHGDYEWAWALLPLARAPPVASPACVVPEPLPRAQLLVQAGRRCEGHSRSGRSKQCFNMRFNAQLFASSPDERSRIAGSLSDRQANCAKPHSRIHRASPWTIRGSGPLRLTTQKKHTLRGFTLMTIHGIMS